MEISMPYDLCLQLLQISSNAKKKPFTATINIKAYSLLRFLIALIVLLFVAIVTT
jgi:hypothetical protein